MAARFVGDLTIAPGSVTNNMFSNSSSHVLEASKQKHVYKGWTNFDLAKSATPVAREEIVHVCTAAGTIRGFHCLLTVDGSSTSVTFDLKKNGSSILTGVVTITDSTGDGVVQDGTLSNTSVAADDILSIALAVSSSTGAQGPFAWVDVEENAAP